MHSLVIAALRAADLPAHPSDAELEAVLEGRLEPFDENAQTPSHRRPVDGGTLAIGLSMAWEQGQLVALRPPGPLPPFGPELVALARRTAAAIPPRTLAELLTVTLEEPFAEEGERVVMVSASNPRGRWDWWTLDGRWNDHWGEGATGPALRVGDLPAARERRRREDPAVHAAHRSNETCPPDCDRELDRALLAASAFLDLDGSWHEVRRPWDESDLDDQGFPPGPGVRSLEPAAFEAFVAERVAGLAPDDWLVALDTHF